MKHLDYKWVALSNTTLGMLIATINASILLIALPNIFRGIRVDPLRPANTSYLLWLILMRVGQGVGGALLFANSSAILTDAFPQNQRGLALGVNSIAAIAGSFLGLVLGGVLAPFEWRLVFLVSVPVGLFATVWAYRSLREIGRAHV